MNNQTALNSRVAALAIAFLGCAVLAQADSPSVRVQKLTTDSGSTLVRVEVETPGSAPAPVPAAPVVLLKRGFRFLIGDDVVTADGMRGHIDGIGQNGKIHVDRNQGADTFEDEETLAWTIGCGYGFCMKEKVITADGTHGHIDGIASNGTLFVYRNQGVDTYEPAATLARTVGCGYGFCIDELVITADGMKGRIDGIGPDRKLHVDRNQGPDAYEYAETLSRR